MTRTTRIELDSLVLIINKRLGLAGNKDEEYTLDHQYGAPSLVRARESVNVSPRMRSGLLADWLRAFIAGMVAVENKA